MADVNGYGLGQIAFTALAHGVTLVKVSAAESISSIKTKVTFDRSMTKNAALISKYNYQITTTTPGAIIPAISSVVAENVDNPTYVELNISEMTNAASYVVEVNPSGPVDFNGNPVDPDNNDESFVGIGIAPYVHSVAAISENRADVIFSESMKDNDAIRDPNAYTFDNGLSVLSVLEVSQETVKLVTSDQTPGLLYALTVDV